VTASLAVFTDPRSVAVVGASADPVKWGHWVARGALRGVARRDVHLVNAHGALIAGVPSVRSLSAIDGTPELVVLCTPAANVPTVVEAALERGARGFLGITAGVDALHGAGTERELVSRIRSAGARLVGPNCLGVYDAAHALELAWGRFTPGHLGIVSQSGQVGLELAGLAASGLGVARFVSVGNQVDVTAAELLEDLVEHEATRVVVVYLESFAGGRDLVATMVRLRDAGKPVIVLTVGASEASRAAARSHTGSLTASTDVVAAACRAAGAILVDTPAQAVELANLVAAGRPPAGPRVGVVSDSGGHGALAADALARHGLTVPRLSEQTSAELARLLPDGAETGNPVDLAGAGEQDIASYSRAVDVLLGSGEVDSVVLSGYFGCYGADTAELAEQELEVVGALADSAEAHARPVVTHSLSRDSAAVSAMRACGLPTMDTIDAVSRSLALATDLAQRQPVALGELAADGPVPDRSVPDRSVPDRSVPDRSVPDRSVPDRSVPDRSEAPGAATGYLAARARLTAYGVSYPAVEPVRSVADLRRAAGELTAPYVLKAGWLEHKTEVGGIVVGLSDAVALEVAYLAMRERLGEGEYVVEEMDRRPDTVELIVGGHLDASFGAVTLVGLGGVHAELHRDVRLALAPLTEPDARQLVESLRGVALLHGWRGRPAVDLDAAARVVVAVSRLLAEDDDVVECEINPLRVGPSGAVAVDALVVTR
jgi:acyl-CoA synthetase (NDP forming)